MKAAPVVTIDLDDYNQLIKKKTEIEVFNDMLIGSLTLGDFKDKLEKVRTEITYAGNMIKIGYTVEIIDLSKVK